MSGLGVDPVTCEIVEGTLASIEAEVEDQIGRTSRSPMIRDAHDFRAGIHDARLRKLTERSYSALVHPVARDFPLDTMRPGDVFFHNDVYLSEGGIGHLPDLCVTVPVFSGGQVVAFVQKLRAADLFKLPGVAETIDWTKALTALDAKALDPETVNDTLGVLLKYPDDIAKVRGSEAARLTVEARAAAAA